MLKDTLSNKILTVIGFNLNENSAVIEIKEDTYCQNTTQETIHLPNFYTKLADPTVQKSTGSIHEDIINIAETCILDKEDYVNWTIYDNIKQWEAIDTETYKWILRAYISDVNMKILVKIPQVISELANLYVEPINPQFDKSEGTVVYFLQIANNMRVLLQSMDIEIEEKPI